MNIKGGKVIHGHARNGHESPTYRSWQSMVSRCTLPHRDIEKKYALRGITMCEEWKDFAVFLKDMGIKPPGTSLDRINNDGPYCASNCRWATPTQQSRNRRNVKLTYPLAIQVAFLCLCGGNISAIARQFKLGDSTPRDIMRGNSWKDALQEATNKYNSYMHFEVQI